MKDILRVCGVGGYVLLGLVAAWRTHASPGVASRRAVDAFLAYTLIVAFGAALLQKDVWPFSNWPLVAGIQGSSVEQDRVVAIDGQGREHDVDYRAWDPFSSDELLAWLSGPMLTLSRADRDRAGAFLLDLAEGGRQRAARGAPVGYVGRVWGPFAAPYFLRHPARWDAPSAVPSSAFVGLRVYRERWRLDERRTVPSSVRRSLLYEYRAR